MIVVPPLLVGAAQVTTADTLRGLADTDSGTEDTVPARSDAEATDADPAPTMFVARTVNVYRAPLVRPATVHVSAGATAAQVSPPGDAVTVYPVMAVPPVLVGASQLTTADPISALAVTVRGTEGTAHTVTGDDATDTGPAPAPFVARAVKV